MTLLAAETWGVPPWEIEEQASMHWMATFAQYERDKARARERALRKQQRR